jgi:hypothetical protein
MEEIEIEGKKIYLKKDIFGLYKVIYPVKNRDGSINWNNLLFGGHWFNWVKIMLVVLLILFFAWSYKHDIEVIRQGCISLGGDIGWKIP